MIFAWQSAGNRFESSWQSKFNFLQGKHDENGKTAKRQNGKTALIAFILAMTSAQGSPLVEAGFSPSLTWDGTNAIAEVSWPTVAGKRYHFQRSTSLGTWVTLGEIYGNGSTASVRVQETPPGSPGGGGNGGDPPPVIPLSFVISAFQENQRELLSMPGGRQVLLEPGTINVPVPQFLSVSVPGEPESPPTPVVALRADRPWNEVYALDPALAEAALTPEEAALRDLFVAAIVFNHNGGGVPAPLGISPGGAAGNDGVFYRLGVEEPDTDGDQLADWREILLGLDPWQFDTDGDGVGDGDEDALGSDPDDLANRPSPDPETPEGRNFFEEYQYGTVVLTGNASLLFMSESHETGSRVLPLQSGPSFKVRAFRRNRHYTFSLSLVSVSVPNQTATLALTPYVPSSWKWWVQIGPNGDATTGPADPNSSGPASTYATASLVPVSFRGSSPCNGFDDTIVPHWQSVPALAGSTGNNTREVIFSAPPDVIGQFEFEIDEAPNASVAPGLLEGSERTLTVTGLDAGETTLRARLTLPDTPTTDHRLKIDVLPRRDVTLTVWTLSNLARGTITLEGEEIITWSPQLDPSPVPNGVSIETVINEIWGVAANVHTTLSVDSGEAWYDRIEPTNGMLDVSEFVFTNVDPRNDRDLRSSRDFDIYIIKQLGPDDGDELLGRVHIPTLREAYVTMENSHGTRLPHELVRKVIAHEYGHLLGRVGHRPETDTEAFMLRETDIDVGPGCEIRREDWLLVHP